MNTTITIPDYSTLDDAQLVERHLAGDRGAFAEIVARHQAMVCALTLSACGDVGRSEDLAQELFIVAWKKLPELREPEKLRGWLSGIARNLAQNSWRQVKRTPTARAEELSPELAGNDGDPREQAMGTDDRALLWRLLESIPQNYREPLLLYYREQRSMGAVAAALEISEETVRQRLVRGRALLGERMEGVLEESLLRTAPTAAFGVGLLVLLPLGAGSAVKATAAVAATGSLATKTNSVSGIFGASAAKGGFGVKLLAGVGALPVILSMLPGSLDFRMRYDAAKSAEARRLLVSAHVGLYVGFALSMAFTILWVWPLHKITQEHPWVYVTGLVIVALVLPSAGTFWSRRQLRRLARLESMEVSGTGAEIPSPRFVEEGPGFEYRSERCLMGWPLVHVRTGRKGSGFRRPVKAWFAIGDVAVGRVFACGGFAVAPLSVGGFTLGLVSSGGFALGGVALGGVALGALAIGGTAIGGLVFGGVAAGWMGRGGMRFTHLPSSESFNEAANTLLLATGAAWALAWLPPLLFIAWHVWHRRARALK